MSTEAQILPFPQTLELTSNLRELYRLVEFVNAFCAPLQLNNKHLTSLHLGLEEIVSNVIRHGYGSVAGHTLTVTLDAPAPDRLRAVIVDTAPAYDPFSRPNLDREGVPLEEQPVGGLGVHLVRQLMDVCDYERKDGKNIVTLELVHADDHRVVKVGGALDAVTSPRLEAEVENLLADDVQHLTFDLSRLQYISSAGLRVFLIAAKKLKAKGGGVAFTSPTKTVKEVFRVAGLLGVLEVR